MGFMGPTTPARKRRSRRARADDYSGLIERKLNDLRREARAKGYPVSVDDSLEPLSDYEKTVLASTSW